MQGCTLQKTSNQGIYGQAKRPISTGQLRVSLLFHIQPINVVIYHGSSGRTHLEVGFSLICFQRLSFPDLATERCPWQDNSYTIGPLTPVLSYWGQLLSTHLRAHWIETDSLLQGQLVSCSRWLPASPQGSDHIFSLIYSESGVWPVRIPIAWRSVFPADCPHLTHFHCLRSSGGSDGVPSI